ncbi:uroporphyrinogen decarboxylase family protein, partial [Lutispora sp.]
TYDKMSVKEYEEFGRPYDLQILDAIKDNTWFNIMHMHGAAPMFEIMEKYPVQAVNWHDRLVDLSLKEGRSKTDKILIGGVDEFKVLNDANEEELLAHLKDALDQVEDKRLILGPGCCVPLYVNEDRFEVAKRLLEKAAR